MNAVELEAYDLEQKIASNSQLAYDASLSSHSAAEAAQQQYSIIKNSETGIERINQVIKETYDEIVKPGTTYVQSVEYLQLMKDAKVVLEAFYNASLRASNLANTHINLAREKGELVENYTKVVNDYSFNLQELASDYNV